MDNINNTTSWKEKLLVPVSIIIAGLLIGGGFYFNTKAVKQTTKTVTQQQKAKSENLAGVLRPIDANDHVLGSLKSRVIIIEYSDTECPYCKLFHSTMLSIMQEYAKDEKVAWVYRHFPVVDLHSRAPKEAEALECAGELGGNGKFWEYTNQVYATTPSDNNLDPAQLTKIATQIGLSSKSFNTCLDSGQYAPRVSLDVQNAEELGASGTPHSIIFDTKTKQYYTIEGAYPYEDLKKAIDLILQS
jgi:protein-disulfide isomerase